MKRIAVIGAGAAGLTATYRIVENNDFDCVTFELTDNIGGIWVCNDQIGNDEYGIPIQSRMYQGLRTNLPKELMELPNYPYKEPLDRSYLTPEEVLRYFEDYANHFNLKKYIKFRHYVKNVTPMTGGKWEVSVNDLKNQKTHSYYFDAVVVCVGTYSKPVIPKIPNIENFIGIQIHSSDYKEPSKFKNAKVLVIGSGSSGLDIAIQACTFADEIYFSHHNTKIGEIQFPKHLIQKPNVKEIRNRNVIFNDGSEIKIDAIVYCTGYAYDFSFLSSKCQVTINNMIVRPLYKQFINIEYPTMSIIGVPRNRPGFNLFDLQVCCFLNVLKGRIQLPSKEKMYEETENDIKERVKVSGKEENYHSLKGYLKNYFESLWQFGNLSYTRTVHFDIFQSVIERQRKDLCNFRNCLYKVISDHEFEIIE